MLETVRPSGPQVADADVPDGVEGDVDRAERDDAPADPAVKPREVLPGETMGGGAVSDGDLAAGGSCGWRRRTCWATPVRRQMTLLRETSRKRIGRLAKQRLPALGGSARRRTGQPRLDRDAPRSSTRAGQHVEKRRPRRSAPVGRVAPDGGRHVSDALARLGVGVVLQSRRAAGRDIAVSPLAAERRGAGQRRQQGEGGARTKVAQPL